jgi:hypothetical protein
VFWRKQPGHCHRCSYRIRRSALGQPDLLSILEIGANGRKNLSQLIDLNMLGGDEVMQKPIEPLYIDKRRPCHSEVKEAQDVASV